MSDDPKTRRPGAGARSAAALRDELARLAREVREELRDAATEVRTELADTREELREEVGAARREVDDELAALARQLEVLWGVDDPPSRGPKATLTRAAIVAAAIELADAEGFDAVSMRSVAKALGVGTMSLYRHVSGKDELLALMIDRVNGELPDVGGLPGTWREKLEAVAWGDWTLAHRHPWMLVAAPGMGRPVAGPNGLAAYEAALAAAAETGLPPVEVGRVVSAVYFLTAGAARSAVENATVEQRTGITNEQWWAAQAAVLDRAVDLERYPTFARLAESGAFGDREPGAPYEDPIDHDAHFRYALAALLDGVEARIFEHRDASS